MIAGVRVCFAAAVLAAGAGLAQQPPALRPLNQPAPKGKAAAQVPSEAEIEAFITSYEDERKRGTTVFAARVLAESRHDYPAIDYLNKSKKVPYHLYVELEGPAKDRLLNERARIVILDEDGTLVSRAEKAVRDLLYLPPRPIVSQTTITQTGRS